MPPWYMALIKAEQMKWHLNMLNGCYYLYSLLVSSLHVCASVSTLPLGGGADIDNIWCEVEGQDRLGEKRHFRSFRKVAVCRFTLSCHMTSYHKLRHYGMTSRRQ